MKSVIGGYPGAMNMAPRARALLCALLLALAGCVRIELTVELEPDGSGRIVETVGFDEVAIRLSTNMPGVPNLMDFLGRGRAEERAALFGETKLVSHELRDLSARGWESKTVYSFGDINKVVLPSVPFQSPTWAGAKMVFSYGQPHLTGTNWIGVLGRGWQHINAWERTLTVRVEPLRPASAPPAGGALSLPEQEKIRDLLPVFRSALSDFWLSVQLLIKRPEGGVQQETLYRLTHRDFESDAVLLKAIQGGVYPLIGSVKGQRDRSSKVAEYDLRYVTPVPKKQAQ